MDPDQDSPIARAGRTFWTFWNYITETVSRLLRPEPPATQINNTNIIQDGTDNNEISDPDQTNNDTTQESEKEMQHVSPASLLSLSRAAVSWNAGSESEIKNINEEVKIYKEGECVIEEEVETGIDVASLSVTDNATQDNQDERWKLYAENIVLKIFEDVNNRLRDEGLNVEGTKQNSHAVEERERTITQQHGIDEINEKDTNLRKDEDFGLDSEHNINVDHNTKIVLEQNIEKIILESQNIAVKQINQCLEGNPNLTCPETPPHSETKMLDDNCSIVSESGSDIGVQEHTMEDSIVESSNDKTEEDEKEKTGNEMNQNIFEGFNAKDESDSAETISKHVACNILCEDDKQDDTTFFPQSTMSKKPDLDYKDEGISDDDELSGFSNEQKEICTEKLCLGTPATVKHKEKSTQEEAFKNTPPAKCEGQDFVSRELYSLYKENQEGVSEHNNECDGSAIQRFLEEGNCKEVQTTLLQEEVGSGEARPLQNSDSQAKSESLDKTELMEKEEAKIESFEVDIAGRLSKPILLDNDMKTVVEDKEFEASFVLLDDGQEKEETNMKILVEFDMDEGLSETKDVDGGEMAEMSGFTKDNKDSFAFLHQTTEEIDLPKTLHQTSVETEPESLTVNMQYTGIDLKDMGRDLCEKEAMEPIAINESEVQLGLTVDKMASYKDEALDAGNNDTSESMETAEKSIKDTFQDIYMLEQLTEPICSEVIDDEILDLWIQQTSTDNLDVKEVGEYHGQDEMRPEMLDSEKVESILDQSVVCDANVLLSTTIESGFFDQPLDLWSSHECKGQELPKMEQLSNINTTVMHESEDTSEISIKSEFETPWKEDLLSEHPSKDQKMSPESTDDDEAEIMQNLDAEVPLSGPVIKSNVNVDDKPLTKMRTLFEVKALLNDQPNSSNEKQNTMFMSDTLAEDLVTYGDQLPLQQNPKEEAIPEDDQDIYMMDATDLDFSSQKSRIAVKNPRVRPPKDPRSLLHKPSLEPSPSKPSNIPAGVPLGVKLPGLGAGFPLLKKTKKAVEDVTETQVTNPVENDTDAAKKEDSQRKPKWMPPGHPGFGNPLMSELKSKLRKTTKE